jgi:DNA-binding GntR family transcriptional regulator
MSGKYGPREHLKEEELVKSLGVSRSVVRQALVQLTAERLLVDVPKKGKTVAVFSKEEIAKLIPIRICLEQLAVRSAIANLTEHHAAELKAIAAELRNSELSLAEQDAADIALHRKIWRMAANEELEALLNRIVGPFHLMACAALLSPIYRRSWPALSLQQVLLERQRDAGGHQPLVNAICNRNMEEAVQAMEDHFTVNDATSAEEFSRKVADLMRRYWHGNRCDRSENE